MKKITSMIVLLLVFATVFCACGSKTESKPTTDSTGAVVESTASSAEPVKDTLNYAINGDITCLDPITLTDGASATVWHQLYDTLFVYDENNNVVGNLAESWAFNDDGTELTIKLVEDVKFHNGDVLTADDVVFTLDYIYNNTTLTSTLTNYESAEAVDANTVKIHYTSPFGAALAQLTSYSTNIVNKKYFDEVGIEGYDKAPIGTGPYKFVSRTAGEKIELTAFEDYFKGPASIKTVTIRVLTDPSAAAIALQSGDIDVIQTPSVDQRDTLKASKGIAWDETMSATTVFLMVNNTDPILSNEKVRQAIWYAIDKQTLVDGALDGLGQTLETLAPGAVANGYDENFRGLGYDPEKAKQLLAEAGYPDGVTITIPTIVSSDTYNKPTTVLQEMLSKVGIDLEIEGLERSAWIAQVGSGTYPITVMTWGVPSLDADFYTRLLVTGSYLHIDSPEIDELLSKGATEMDPVARKAYYMEINELIRDHAYLIPLYCGYNYIAYREGLQGIKCVASNEYEIYNMHW